MNPLYLRTKKLIKENDKISPREGKDIELEDEHELVLIRNETILSRAIRNLRFQMPKVESWLLRDSSRNQHF
jgi:hypothetical protein